MSDRYERESRIATVVGYSKIGEMLAEVAAIARELDLPAELEDAEGFARVSPDAIVAREEEFKKQASRLAEVFAGSLGISEAAYIDKLPFQFYPLKLGEIGRTHNPLIVPVHREFDLVQMAEIAGFRVISPDFLLGMVETKNFPEREPGQSYVTGVGDIYPSPSIDAFLDGLKPGERPLSAYDGIAMYLNDPSILLHGIIALPGTRKDDRIAAMVILDGQPTLEPWFTRSALAMSSTFASPAHTYS